MPNPSALARRLSDLLTVPVRDPLWKHVYLPDAFKTVIADKAFQKLANIRQLGPTYLIYPGATHTRQAHSFGVFHLAWRILDRILRHQAAPHSITEDGARAFLAAALLHDLGHFPYTHSLKDLPLLAHEALTARIMTEGSLAQALGGWCDPALAAAIVDDERPASDPQIILFRHLLSGVLDPDKLDYLNRDAYYCGVPYGVQDIAFVLDRIQPHQQNGICLDEQGVTAVESILFSKYLMYRTVYWHRGVRCATAMIKTALLLALEAGTIQPDELYGLDDYRLVTLADSRGWKPFELVADVNSRHLYQCVLDKACSESLQAKLRDPGVRAAASRSLARQLRGKTAARIEDWHVIIDLPEPVSFETSLPIISTQGETPYAESGTVFSRPVIDNFARGLTRLRIFVHPALDAASAAGVAEQFYCTDATFLLE